MERVEHSRSWTVRCPLEMDIPLKEKRTPNGIDWPEKNHCVRNVELGTFENLWTHNNTYRDCLTISTLIWSSSRFHLEIWAWWPMGFLRRSQDGEQLARSTPGHWLDLPCPKTGHRYTQKPEMISTCVWSIFPVLPTPKWKESLHKPSLSGKGYALGLCSRGLLKFTQKKERVARMIQRIIWTTTDSSFRGHPLVFFLWFVHVCAISPTCWAMKNVVQHPSHRCESFWALVATYGRCSLPTPSDSINSPFLPAVHCTTRGAKHDHHGDEKRGVSSQRPQSPGFRPVHLAPEVSYPSSFWKKAAFYVSWYLLIMVSIYIYNGWYLLNIIGSYCFLLIYLTLRCHQRWLQNHRTFPHRFLAGKSIKLKNRGILQPKVWWHQRSPPSPGAENFQVRLQLAMWKKRPMRAMTLWQWLT